MRPTRDGRRFQSCHPPMKFQSPMNVPPEPRASAPTTDLKAWAQDWIAAWNSRSRKRILSHYADEVEFHSPFVARLLGKRRSCLKGIGALRDYFAEDSRVTPAPF